MESRKRSLIKSVIWRLIGIIVLGSISWMITNVLLAGLRVNVVIILCIELVLMGKKFEIERIIQKIFF